MTTPVQRTRSLRWGAELLHALANHAQTRREDREAALRLLADYPGPATVEKWIASHARVLPLASAKALSRAGDLLRSIQLGERCPPALAFAVKATLRDFPGVGELRQWSDHRLSQSLVGEWLLPEDVRDRPHLPVEV
jgi:hypothetical protein